MRRLFFAMTNDQLVVICVAAIVVGATFAPSLVTNPVRLCSSDQRILKWTGVIVAVMTAACAYLGIEVLRLSAAVG